MHTPGRTVQSIQSLEFREHIINKQALQAGLPIALLIPISACILWFALARRDAPARDQSREPRLRRTRTRIGELPTKDVPCEISPLVVAVNTLLTRLRDAFASQRRFVQDAAHELRTPITAMTLQLENLKAHADGCGDDCASRAVRGGAEAHEAADRAAPAPRAAGGAAEGRCGVEHRARGSFCGT